MLNVTPICAFSDNYIWMLQNDKKQVVVVDPGDAQAVIQVLNEKKLDLCAILVTHYHNDHTGGVTALADKYSIPVYGPKDCPFPGITHSLGDGDCIEILNHQFNIKGLPGHTLDHISYLYEHPDSPQLFCGDTLFLAGCGRVFEGTMQQMLTAMHYFKTLPANTLVYCTHEYSLSNLAFAQAVEPGNSDIEQSIAQCSILREQNLPTLPSTLATEFLINPFLRCENSAVQRSATEHAQQTLNSELEVFSTIRVWKNSF